MANILCPLCGYPIAVDRGLRFRGTLYCSRECLESNGRLHPGGEKLPEREEPPDVSVPETRDR